MRRFVIEPFHDSLCFPVASFPVDEAICRAILADFPQDMESLTRGSRFVIHEGSAGDIHREVETTIGFSSSYFGLRMIDEVYYSPPYLVHTDFELPFFLNGSKKLGWLDVHPTMSPFETYRLECFERLVQEGMLEKQERLVHERRGARGQVFYTLPGESWRVQAYEMEKAVSARAGGWNAALEELLGMLMGYSDQENKWWIEDCERRDVFPSGMRLYIALTQEEAEWVEQSAFRALPPPSGISFVLHGSVPTAEGLASSYGEHPAQITMAKIVVPLLPFQAIASAVRPDVYCLAADRVRDLNEIIRGKIKFMNKPVLSLARS